MSMGSKPENPVDFDKDLPNEDKLDEFLAAKKTTGRH